MNYLLDTHTFLWFINDDAAMSQAAHHLMEAPDNGIVLSVASLWEMAIKASLGKLTVPSPFDTFMSEQLDINDIALLNIRPEHTGAVAILPFHHRDPFDRLIIAQSLSDQLPVIGKDAIFDSYGIHRHW